MNTLRGPGEAGTPPSNVPLIRSALIPSAFSHGFSTRAGGASAPPFDSLNLGGKWGDDPEVVGENRRRFLGAVGGPAPLYVARQVHGVRVIRVGPGDTPGEIASLEADGLCTDRPRMTLGVFVADCVPILFVDPATGSFAAVHAGWRGTVAGVAAVAVRALAEIGARPADLRVALGPAIAACCFEVGPEVVAAFTAAGLGDAILPPPSRPGPERAHVDLKRALAIDLERAGVDPAGLDAIAACTACDRQRFFSYRRDGGATGQMMGAVGRLLASG